MDIEAVIRGRLDKFVGHEVNEDLKSAMIDELLNLQKELNSMADFQPIKSTPDDLEKYASDLFERMWPSENRDK